MPTVFSHPAPILCLGIALGKSHVSARLIVAAICFSILPDLDVIGFKFGVRYADIFGHRGFSHSLLFAILSGAIAASAAPLLHARRVTAFMFCGGAVLVHIFLDALTNGGLGVAFFWPFSESRYFFPWRPIEVSPFSPKILFSQRGLKVFTSELHWVWLPSMAAALVVYAVRKLGRSIKISSRY